MRTNSAPGTTPLTLLLLLTHGALFAQDNAASGNSAQQELTEIRLPGSPDDDYQEEAELGFQEDHLSLPPTATGEERLQRLFTLYRDAMNDGMYGEADTLAKQIVELAIEMHGLDSDVTARAITNLAIAQHGAEDYAAAQLNFIAAIEIIERISDRLNEDLINPLKGLAATELAQGKPMLAAETYQRAMHISHVNFGPHNTEQLEVLESLAETYKSAGEFDEAQDMLQRIFALQVRNFTGNAEEMVPALLHQARWMHRLRLYDRERHTWRRAIAIIEQQRGKDHLSLIQPLIGLGNSYLYVNLNEPDYYHPAAIGSGEIYLKRAVRIAENNPDADWKLRAETLIELGDYYLLTEKTNRALRRYRDAWNILSTDESRHAERERLLQSLPVVQDIAPPKVYGLDTDIAGARRDGYETGHLEYRYTLSARGRATRVELIEIEPPGVDEMIRKVNRDLRYFVRRPKMVDGNIEETPDMIYRHEFYYRPASLPNAGMDEEQPLD